MTTLTATPRPVPAELLAALQARFGVPYLDYSRDPRLTVEDFADLDHLSVSGALKFSRILNEEVIRPRGVCSAAVP